jgi:hypothetical protein
MERGYIHRLVNDERDYQKAKHDSESHEAGTWILLIEEELREAKQALIKGGNGRDTWSHELVQVAALCFAALEDHGMSDSEGRAI